MIGVDAARKIVGSVSFGGFLERMKNGQGFEDVDGIGPEKSGSVMEWYQIAKNKEALEHLLQEVRIIPVSYTHLLISFISQLARSEQ